MQNYLKGKKKQQLSEFKINPHEDWYRYKLDNWWIWIQVSYVCWQELQICNYNKNKHIEIKDSLYWKQIYSIIMTTDQMIIKI